MKLCSKCKTTKSKQEFHKCSRSKDGLHSNCKICRNLVYKLDYNKNPEKYYKKSIEYAKKNPTKISEIQKTYYKNNKDKVKKRFKNWREKNYNYHLDQCQKWKKDNKELVKCYNQKWNKENNKQKNYLNSKRRADLLNRTMKWSELDLIKKFYENCPEGYHVDHIIPLKGKEVSGLHVLNNLQYLLAEDNLRKNNKFLKEN